MSKIRFADAKGMVAEVANPDEAMAAHIRQRIVSAILREASEFAEEVMVGVRKLKLKPGQKRTFKSKPIVITLDRPRNAP